MFSDKKSLHIATLTAQKILRNPLKFKLDYTLEFYKWSLNKENYQDKGQSIPMSSLIQAFESYSDVDFVCHDGIAKGHKAVLSKKSEVFYTSTFLLK